MSEWNDRRTGRWRGVVAVPLVALSVGLVANRPDILLLAAVGVVYAVYPRVTRAPEPSVSVERRLDDASPGRGDAVTVTVTVQNEGDSPLLDCRVVDGVPPVLDVVEGSPRDAGVLRAGRSRSFSYAVRAERGTHRFDPATVVVRDVSGEHEVTATVDAETELDCTVAETSPPLRQQTLAHVGRVLSDRGGAGVEFHRTREYQRGDPLSRVDWKRYARTGEPTTVEFRREQAASVVLLVDARSVAYRARSDEPHAVAYSVSAARQVATALLDVRNEVGVAGVGRSLAWISPGTGRRHRDDVTDALAGHETFASRPPAGETAADAQFDRLRERLSDGSQVVLFSPLTDDAVVDAARTLDVEGHPASVVSPTVTDTGTPERRLAAAERRTRVSDLRNASIPVVTWDPDRALAAAVDATARRWSG